MRTAWVVVLLLALAAGSAAVWAGDGMGNGTAYPPDTGGLFTDVPTDHWAYEDVKYLSDRGIITGVPGGQYRGDQALDRYSAAAMIARAMRYLQNNPSSVTTEDLDALKELIFGLSDEVDALRNQGGTPVTDGRLEVRVAQNEAAIGTLRADLDALGSGDASQLATRVRNNFILSLTGLMMGIVAIALAVIWP
ncbi:MAG: S-layer homology domain-containing protein [Candidatus Bipolaricaulota bacterium]|nr:MAG: S-layer homology domain-containing protein [Candidatus Bipolaricaulota bacterium]